MVIVRKQAEGFAAMEPAAGRACTICYRLTMKGGWIDACVCSERRPERFPELSFRGLEHRGAGK